MSGSGEPPLYNEYGHRRGPGSLADRLGKLRRARRRREPWCGEEYTPPAPAQPAPEPEEPPGHA